MKKLYILLIFVILLSLNTLGNNVQYGTVKIKIINRPPIIKEMLLIPKEAYFDSILECDAEINDESSSTVTLHYKWYRNGNLLEEKSNLLTKHNENDNILCEITPEDSAGLPGNMKSISVTILKTPIRVKVLKPILNLIGVKRSTNELKSQSMGSVTGMVVGEVTGNETGSLILFLTIFILIIVNLNLIRVIFNKKTST